MLLVPAAQQRADDVRERSAHRRGEGERPILAEALARVGLEQVAAIDAEEMVRLVDLHQPRRAERVPERQQPAHRIRPALRHPFRGAVPAEAEREQEGQLDARERVVYYAEGAGSEGRDRYLGVVRARGQRAVHRRREEERRLAVQQVGIGRAVAEAEHLGQRCGPEAGSLRRSDRLDQRIVRSDDGGGGATARHGDVAGVEPGSTPRIALERLSRVDPGRIVGAHLRFSGGDAREERLELTGRQTEAAPHDVHHQIAHREHVEALRLIVLSEHGADLVLRHVPAGDDLSGQHQHGGGSLRRPRRAHRLGECLRAAVRGSHHELRPRPGREPKLDLQGLRHESDVDALVGIEPGHRRDQHVGDRVAGAAPVGAGQSMQRGQRAVRRGGKQVGQRDRLADAERVLPVVGTGASLFTAVRIAEEQVSRFVRPKLRMRAAEEVAAPADGREIPRVCAVLGRNHEDPATRHADAYFFVQRARPLLSALHSSALPLLSVVVVPTALFAQ